MNDEILTVLDFETTGLVKGFRNEPWQIGIVELKNGEINLEKSYNSLINVGKRPFNIYAPGRHEMLREKIYHAKTLEEQWSDLAGFLCDNILVAHNIATEKKILQATFPLHNFKCWIDTLKLSRLAFGNLPDYKLENLIVYLDLDAKIQKICPNLEPHDAYFDAVAAALLLQKIRNLPQWCDLTVCELAKL